MSECGVQDRDPTIPNTSRDPGGRYDDMREPCPVVFSDIAGWRVFRPDPQRLPERAGFPAAGFATLPVAVE